MSPATCPECGAALPTGLACFDLLGLVIAWEAEDAALQALHFETVATYNLQHPAQFMPEALAHVHAGLAARVRDGLGIAEIRRRTGARYQGPAKVLRPEHERRPVLRAWPLTLADIWADGQPAGAAERVQAWTKATLAELDKPSPV